MLKISGKTLLKNCNHNMKCPKKNSILLNRCKQPTKTFTRTHMKRESSVVTPIRKHDP